MSEVGMIFIGIGAAGFFSGIYCGWIFTRDYYRKENYWKAEEAKKTLNMYMRHLERRGKL